MELHFLVEVSLAQKSSTNSRIIHKGKDSWSCDFQSTSANEKQMDSIESYYDLGTTLPEDPLKMWFLKHSMHSLPITC